MINWFEVILGFVMLLFGLSLWFGPRQLTKSKFLFWRGPSPKPGQYGNVEDHFGEQNAKTIGRFMAIIPLLFGLLLLISGLFGLGLITYS